MFTGISHKAIKHHENCIMFNSKGYVTLLMLSAISLSFDNCINMMCCVRSGAWSSTMLKTLRFIQVWHQILLQQMNLFGTNFLGLSFFAYPQSIRFLTLHFTVTPLISVVQRVSFRFLTSEDLSEGLRESETTHVTQRKHLSLWGRCESLMSYVLQFNVQSMGCRVCFHTC